MSNSSEKLTEQLINSIAKGGGITLAGSGFGRIIQFGFHILLGRVLGVTGYGLYALGHSVLQLASEFPILGLNQAVVRFIAIYRGQGKLSHIKGTILSAFFIVAIASIVMAFILFVSSGFISDRIFNDAKLSSVLRAFAIALPFYVLMHMSGHTARGFQRMEYYVAIQKFTWPVTNVLFIGIAFLLGYRLMGAVYGFLASMVISASLGLILIPKRIFPKGLQVEPRYDTKKLLRFSLPMIFIGLGQIVLNQTDRLVVGAFMSSADVGIYSAAARIAIQCNFIITAFNMAFAPMIADLHDGLRTRELGVLFKLVTRWIVTLTLPIVLILVLFPTQVIMLFGGEFIGGSEALIALAIGYLVNVTTGSVGLILIMAGKQDIELVNVLSMALINVGLNIWLIQAYGILGVAIATGLSIAVVNLIRVIEVYKVIGVQPYTRRLLKPLLSAGVVALLYRLLTYWTNLNMQWSIGLSLCILLYIVILFIMGLEREDRAILRAIRQKLLSI